MEAVLTLPHVDSTCGACLGLLPPPCGSTCRGAPDIVLAEDAPDIILAGQLPNASCCVVGKPFFTFSQN